jgi:NAD(P)-dependent dehydrogenase (short-subunit alcohol dehydrogenase family)
MNLELAGRRAIVTGGSRGIGLAIARLLAEEGVHVALCGRTPSDVESAVGTIEAQGGRAIGGVVDVADPDAYRTWLADTTDALGGLDIFVANVTATADAGDESAWVRGFEVDLMHTVRGCNAVLPALRASSSGAIVINSSVGALISNLGPEWHAYSAFKAAMITYGSQLSQTLAPDGVRVNMVAPGPIVFPGGDWEVTEREDPESFDAMRSMIALGRMGTPLEVARVVAFLASPAASFVTGVNVRIDGGMVKAVNY